MNSLPISVCIPVRNEERNLPECLESLGTAFDEVVVVDSGSTDSTREIAERAGATFLNFVWDGRFPKKRNWTLRHYKFKHPWVLFLDADERLTDSFIDELRRTIPTTSHVGFWLQFTNWFMNRPIRHGDTFRKLALFRTDAGQYECFPEEWWSHLDMEVHEHPILDGTTGEIHQPLDHHDYRGLEHYFAKHNQYSTWEVNRYLWLKAADKQTWSTLTSRQKFKYRYLRKWWLPYVYFVCSYFLKRGFLDGSAGWALARVKLRYFEEIGLKIREAENVLGTVKKQ